MQIEKNEVVGINGIYISALWQDWYAAEFLVKREGRIFRLRYPYKTKARAQQMLQYLEGKVPELPKPDYRPIIHTMENGRAR